jgi:hypothetical protein
MSKGKKRRQKGEYTRQQPSPPAPPLLLPPARAERLNQALGVYMLMASLSWLWEVEDVDDVPILLAATNWFGSLCWPQTNEEFWTGPPLLDREPEQPPRAENQAHSVAD